MANSLIPIAGLARSQPYNQAHHNPFKVPEVDLVFSVELRGDRVWHRQTHPDDKGKPIFQLEQEVQYAIGSGTHGHSYLSDREGYLFMTAISWYSSKHIWDLSPQFPRELFSGRAVPPTCLYCHANRALPQAGFINRYQEPIFQGHAIGCERCHGPGAKHVENPGLSPVSPTAAPFLPTTVAEVDFSIVNPGKLKASLREAVCQQCHLEGEVRVLRRNRGLYDYRPGLALEDFWSIFVHARESGEDKKAVNHVEQMYLSSCFTRSHEPQKLGCISCHNPHQHVGPEQRFTYYRQRCLACHAELKAAKDKSVPCALDLTSRRLKNDDCLACHMPHYSSTDIVHNASTDHRIVRRPRAIAPDPLAAAAGIPLASFHRGRPKKGDKELLRDLGIALIRLSEKNLISPRQVDFAILLLEEALQNDAKDGPAWEEKAKGLVLQNRSREGLASLETLLNLEPNRELAVTMAGTITQNLGQLGPAIKYWRRAAALNPWLPSYRANLAQLLAHQGSWDEARSTAQAWLRLDPQNILGRKLWVQCLLQTGRREQARAEFARIESLRPPELEQLKNWFAEQMGAK